MSAQESLFAPPSPPKHERIDLRCCNVEELLPLEGDLCIADPPWLYSLNCGESLPSDHYEGLPIATICAHLAQIRAPRLVCWMTWPVLASDWPEKLDEWGRWTTGGSWHKSAEGDGGHYGQGYHWAGCSEPVLIYTKPKAHNSRAKLRNAWYSPPGKHSRKPVEWMAQMIRRWCPPGGRVVDPYAGLGAVAEAVLVAGEGRTYLGAEIDPKRHADALGLLAQVSV